VLLVPALLREFRSRRSLSQQELADLAGVSRTTVLKAESGKQQPRPKTLRKLARVLKIDPSELQRRPSSTINND
jgi:transcriptional regulator with XRE-family HTH domain